MSLLSQDARDAIDAELTEVIYPAVGYFSCPYFQLHEGLTDEHGMCDRGCYSEPACVTSGNALEYMREVRDAADEIVNILTKEIK